MEEDGEGRTDRGFVYKVNESEIFVRNRPKSLSIETGDKSDAYLSVTDSWCSAPFGKQFMWFPWNEGRDPTAEMFYACNKTLLWWIFYKKLPKIELFCDGGTHRSVTVFGAFLMTYLKKGEYEKIVLDRKPVSIDEHSLEQCNPIYYIEAYLKKYPEDILLFTAMGKDRLGRLDGHCNDIYQTIKNRFGDNK